LGQKIKSGVANVASNIASAMSNQPPPANEWSNIGSSDQQKLWQKMYDNEAAKTQRLNAQQMATASRNASQQAAIAGYNPQMGARLNDVMMAQAGRANQGRDDSLQQFNLQTCLLRNVKGC
jgi:hypothetical protein